MTFRLPFQISRVGALCRPASPDRLVSKLTLRKGNLKKLILYQLEQNPSANLLQKCKHKISYVPTRFSSTKLNDEHSTKCSPNKTSKKYGSKSVLKGEASDYYQKMDEINFGSYFNRMPIQAKSKMRFSRTKRNNPQKVDETLPKYDYYGMENYYKEIKNIDDTMCGTGNPVISPPEPEIQNIMPDAELKIQNDIWKQSSVEIINNLNSKNSMRRFIYGKRKTLKNDFWKNISTSKMLTKLIQSSQPSAKDSKLHLGTKTYPNIYLSRKKKPPVKFNLESKSDKQLLQKNPSNLLHRLLHKSRKCDTVKEEEKITYENCEESIQASAIPDVIETNNCKYKISHLPLKLNASKIFMRQQSKSPKENLQTTDTYIKVNPKPNVIMATVNNRQLNNPSPEFMEHYSYNNSLYHMYAMQDMENFNFNDLDCKYPKICYNAENDTYLLKNEQLVPTTNASQCQLNEGKTCVTTTDETDKATTIIKPIKSDKKLKIIPIPRKKIIPKAIPKVSKSKLKIVANEGIVRQCSKSKSVNISNVQSAKAANLEELNEAVSVSKPNLVKIEPPLTKKQQEQKVRNKVKTSRTPKTLGEIYGVGKIPFLVEVSKSGQANHKQYLVVIQCMENKRQESSENNTNSPIPLTLNNNDLLSPHASQTDYYESKTNAEQTSKKHAPKLGNMIGLVKVKNKILPLLEINNDKGFESPLIPTKLSQFIHSKLNSSDKKEEGDGKEQQPTVATICSKTVNNAKDRYEKTREQLQRIMHNAEYIKDQRKSKELAIYKQARQYSSLTRRNQTMKTPNYKILTKIRHTNRTAEYQQKRNYCRMCSKCGQCPCVCCNCGCGGGPSCPCTPCGWYPCNSCRPQCCPKFKLDYCCPRARWDCEIPIPPCRKIDAPYPSYGENMPMWCKEPTECFDYDQHILQPKNQVSRKIPLMEESIPKVTVVDPALQRKCCRDKWCEPYYPCVDQRICFDCPYKVPVDYCCPRGRPHCYCWHEKPCTRKPPPYRCFSDEELDFPEVEVTEHDLARRFASDLYRRMGRKCKLPFAPACSVECDLRSGEPKPVCKHDPKADCATTCLPPGTYPACCTPVRIPPCQIPGCDTCINCCMPMEGHKKTRCSKRCYPQDCCGYCPKEEPQTCPKEPPQNCPKTDCDEE